MEASGKIKGYKEIERDLLRYAKNVTTGVEKALWKWALKLAARAQRLCPVETGIGRASIIGMIEKAYDLLTGVYGSNEEHLIFVEFGTLHIDVGTPESPRTTWPAKEATRTLSPESMPFMRVAWAENQDAIEKDLKAVGIKAAKR